MNTINSIAPVHYSSNTTTENLLIKSMLTLTQKVQIYLSTYIVVDNQGDSGVNIEIPNNIDLS